jgi:acyl carrier protein
MNRDEVKAELERVFRDVFSDDTIVIHDGMTAKDIKEWDSLNHINLIVGAEQRFGVKLTMREVAGLSNVGKFIDAIAVKLGSANMDAPR